MNNPVRLEKDTEIAVIIVDNPPVNALSQAVRAGILEAIEAADSDPEVAAIVLRCAGRTFIAGADIREFGKPLAAPDLVSVIARIEGASKPVVAAIHGTALGGGFEITLGCHYRCASPAARVGFPEVKLGILPGAGGTQRLPRLTGIGTALEVIVSGDPVPAPRACEMGAIDEIIDGDLATGAIAAARRLVAEKTPLRRTGELPLDGSALPDGFFASFRARIAARTRGQFAPERCIRAVEGGLAASSFEEGRRNERALFEECLKSPESAALRTMFFAERQCARIPGIDRDTAKRDIGTAAVIGAGTMGGGIAMNFANAGIPVTVVERDREALDRGLAVIRGNYERSAKRGRITEAEATARMALIHPALDMAQVAGADIIIEAVFENMDIKKQVFAALDKVARAGAILATNTSTLDVDEIAATTARPGDVIGTHFFSPANVMRLLEVVRGKKTEKEVIATAMGLAKKIGKTAVLSGVCYGFIGNRMLEGYLREANLLLLEGATPSRVDKVLYDFGFPMGPFAMSDLAGIDVGYLVRQERRPLIEVDKTYGAPGDALYRMGRLGLKTGAGYFRYDKDSRTPQPDPVVKALIVDEAKRLAITRRDIDDGEILERCLLPLVNEGALILDEGIALRGGDIDVVWNYGYGFPRYRGGPMFWADATGLGEILARIEKYRARFGDRHWTPAPLIERLAASGGRLSDYQENPS